MASLDTLLIALLVKTPDVGLDQLEPIVWDRISAVRAPFDFGADLGWRTGVTAMMLAIGMLVGGPAATSTLAFTFAHPVMLQTVAIIGPNESPVSATCRRPNASAASYSVALPALASGAYEANGSGHSMNGVIRFTVQ